MSLPALLRRLRRPCLSCATSVGLLTDVCESCVDRLPVAERWAFREARDAIWRDRSGYRSALDDALAWLATHPRPDAATQTNAKEA